MSSTPVDVKRGVRVLRPVSRPSAAAPATHSPQLRTNRAAPPSVSQLKFALNAQHLIRKLRDVMYRSRNNQSTEETVRTVKEVEKLYNELEVYATAVSSKGADHSEQSSSIYHLAGQNPDALSKLNILTDSMRAEEYREMSAIACGESSHKTELLNLLKPVPSVFRKTEPTVHNVKESHDQFLAAMKTLLAKEKDLRQARQKVELHTAGFQTSVLEAEFGKRRENQFVPQLKATILVQYGHLIAVRLGCVTETLWSEYGELHDSVYAVYRMMGLFATSRLLNSSSTTRLTSVSTIYALLIFLQIFTSAFSTPCCSCRRLLNDFLPPTRIIDVNPARPVFQHEACSHLPLS